MKEEVQLYRGEMFTFTASPFERADCYRYERDGALVVSDGRIVEMGPAESVIPKYPGVITRHFAGRRLIMPGLIDAHVHYPQMTVMGMYGEQLLEWLNRYTFPAEERYNAQEDKDSYANVFLQELFARGTTSCMAWSTNQADSVTALFKQAKLYGMCLITGKNLMDRNAPDSLLDGKDKGEADTRRLIAEWDGVDRLHYAVTPRFAPSSTPEQLAMAGRLLQEYPTVYMQTHLSENSSEQAWVQELFPACRDYLEVYERAGLLTDRCFFGHSVHLSTDERERISRAGATAVHCPTSNMFLGSGLFDWEGFGRVALATDVGAGTSLSMLTTMGEAYKVSRLIGKPRSPLELLWSCTQGAAEALGLSDEIGSFKAGSYADFVVVDYNPDGVTDERIEALLDGDAMPLEHLLFGLQVMSDDCRIIETYVKGELAYSCRWDFC